MNNSTKMSLYSGGNKQKVVLENAEIINSLEMMMGTSQYNSQGPNTENNISNDFVLMTGNLRTYHPKKYLVPGLGKSFQSIWKTNIFTK